MQHSLISTSRFNGMMVRYTHENKSENASPLTYLSLFNGVKTLHGLSPPVATPSSSAASPGLRRLKWIRFLLVVHAPRWNFSRPHDLPPSLPKMPFSLSSSENSCSSASAPRKSFFHLIDDAAGGVLKRMLLLLALGLLL